MASDWHRREDDRLTPRFDDSPDIARDGVRTFEGVDEWNRVPAEWKPRKIREQRRLPRVSAVIPVLSDMKNHLPAASGGGYRNAPMLTSLTMASLVS